MSSVESLIILCLICAINLNFAKKKKNAQNGKRFSRLPEAQKVAPNGKSCWKVTKHNRDRPPSVKNGM